MQEIVTADLDRDGDLDVVGASGSPSNIVVWYGNGDGTHARVALYSMPRGDLAVADLNEDGWLDLISAYDSWVYVRLAVPGQDFAPAVEHMAALRLRYEWRNREGTVVSTEWSFFPSNLPPGQYTFTVTAFDGRGGQASDSMVLTIRHNQEIYFHAITSSNRTACCSGRTTQQPPTAS